MYEDLIPKALRGSSNEPVANLSLKAKRPWRVLETSVQLLAP
jgi:hypothetical protein